MTRADRPRSSPGERWRTARRYGTVPPMRILRPSCATLLLCASTALAQTAEPRLQDAIVVAKGGTITISRLPIRTPTGTILRDVTIELHVTADGRVTLATDGAGRALASGAPAAPSRQVALRAVPSGTPAETNAIELPQRPSPPVVFQHFTAGTYTASDGTLVQLQDRGQDLIHGIPAWTLSGDGPIASATFYSGPPRLNPRSRRLSRAGLTGEEYAYGTSDSGTSDVFGTGALIGVQQSGATLRVVSFHHGCCSDSNEPTSSVTYTRVGR